MLDITILKTDHAGRREAQRLSPYMRKADVYSPESAGFSVEEAEQAEFMSREMIVGNATVDEIKAIQAKRKCDGIVGQYTRAETLLTVRHRVPLYIPERFSSEDAERLVSMQKKVEEEKYPSAREYLAKGQISDFLRVLQEGLDTQTGIVGERDRKIATNLPHFAEGRIRAFYGDLVSGDPLKLVINIGCVHRPERYIGQECTVVDLSGKLKLGHNFWVRLVKARFNDVADEEIELLALRYGVYKLMENGNFCISPRKIQSMGRRELEDFLRSQM